MTDTIRKRADTLNAIVKQALADIVALRQECPHVSVKISYSGGLNSSGKPRWIDHECRACGHEWFTEQT